MADISASMRRRQLLRLSAGSLCGLVAGCSGGRQQASDQEQQSATETETEAGATTTAPSRTPASSQDGCQTALWLTNTGDTAVSGEVGVYESSLALETVTTVSATPESLDSELFHERWTVSPGEKTTYESVFCPSVDNPVTYLLQIIPDAGTEVTYSVFFEAGEAPASMNVTLSDGDITANKVWRN